MPRHLIYTSAPRGLTPGQSGYCTVARSRDLREALIPRIEKLSYYTPESGENPAICAHRILDLRGTKFHVLSRIVDAGLDFTKRRSFLAHHIILEPDELGTTARPAVIFRKWRGWIDSWRDDPQWLENILPLPGHQLHEPELAKADVWVGGDEADRRGFINVLAERGADWDVTFTNCFQPGDNPNDFDIKAAWPNTPGFDTAKRLDAQFISIRDLPKQMSPQPILESTIAEPVIAPTIKPAPERPSTNRLLTASVAVLTVLAFSAALYVRHRTPAAVANTPAPQPVEQPERIKELDVLLPARPTWLALPNFANPISPVADLMRELRANEVFTKDLECTIQTNLLMAPLTATLLAEPDKYVLRFTATNIPPVTIVAGPGELISSKLAQSFTVEIPGRFRIVTIQTPVELSRRFLQIGTNVELHPDFHTRVHHVELPPGAQLALRPLVLKNERWIDPLETGAQDLGIVPSTLLDLPAVEEHARQIIRDKEAKLRAYEDERIALADAQKKLLTNAQTPEQLKGKDRLRALELAIPAAAKELADLRAKIDAIPSDANRIDRFALFLCLSNVNTEVFRFVEKP